MRMARRALFLAVSASLCVQRHAASTASLAATLQELRADEWLPAFEAADVRSANDLATLESADLVELGLPVGTRARIAAWKKAGGPHYGRIDADAGYGAGTEQLRRTEREPERAAQVAAQRRGLQATPSTPGEWETAMRASILDGYDPAVPPVLPTRVSIGLNIFKVTTIDLSTHAFEISAWIRAR